MAENIDANLINAGAVNGKKMYMDMQLLATQVWVTDALAELWNAIASVSSQASDASRTGRSLSVIDATWKGSWAGNGCYKIGIDFKRGNGSTFTTGLTDGSLAGNQHYHSISFSESGGQITLEIGAPAGNGSTTSSFNIADTTFYKDRAFGSVDQVVSASMATFSYTVTATVKSISGKTLKTTSENIPVKSIYDSGYDAGYKVGKEEGREEGYNAGLADAKCNRYHEGDRKGNQELVWVSIN